MAERIRLARPYFILLAVVASVRWILGLAGVPYATGTDKASIVLLTVFASIFYGAFLRNWKGHSAAQAAAQGATMAFFGQLVIFLSTVIAQVAGLHTYFNDPIALNQPAGATITLGMVMAGRAGGLVVNCVLNAIAGAIGWFVGGTLPK